MRGDWNNEKPKIFKNYCLLLAYIFHLKNTFEVLVICDVLAINLIKMRHHANFVVSNRPYTHFTKNI